MNVNNAAQFLPLVQALADGKTIQIDAALNGSWWDVDKGQDLSFRLPPNYYRIKPEPKVLYFVFNGRGEGYSFFERESSAAATAAAIGGTYKKFVEEM